MRRYKMVRLLNRSKKIAILFLIFPFVRVWGQETSFQIFLSEFEKSECIGSTSFGKPYNFIDNAEQYSKFLPQADEECCCESENIRWLKGSYTESKNYIVVALQRYCQDYQDGNSQWFMENEVTDYVIITYYRDGEIIDCKTVGRSGSAYKIHLSAPKHGFGIVVEQRVVDDCSLLHQYKDIVYAVFTNEYMLTSKGKIKERNIDAPHKEVVDVMSSVKQFTFEQFISYFQKWDKSHVDYTLFTPPSERSELPFESCLSLIPDTLDHNCWPRDILWIPCKYTEDKDVLSFFLVKACWTPKVGFFPYKDYMILEFFKDGTFKCARNIYHWDDNTDTEDITKQHVTKALKAFYKEKQSS